MPVFRKLSPAEVNQLSGIGVRKLIELEYDELLNDFSAGDIGEVTLANGEKRMTVMSRLKAAARRRSLSLLFRRTGNASLLRFVVNPEAAPRAAATLKGAGKPAKKGGKLQKA